MVRTLSGLRTAPALRQQCLQNTRRRRRLWRIWTASLTAQSRGWCECTRHHEQQVPRLMSADWWSENTETHRLRQSRWFYRIGNAKETDKYNNTNLRAHDASSDRDLNWPGTLISRAAHFNYRPGISTTTDPFGLKWNYYDWRFERHHACMQETVKLFINKDKSLLSN